MMLCEALEGKKYVRTLLDDFTRYAAVVCINRKYSVTDERISVLAPWQRQTGCYVKRVRTDQGTEYFGFVNYCRFQGFVRALSPICTPKQNARAKRLNRTLSECMRALLHEHNAPKVL
jgi:transposase InsO family protein